MIVNIETVQITFGAGHETLVVLIVWALQRKLSLGFKTKNKK
jgi:hypothetical protein